METPGLSIIVPVYRVEQYVAECIESILAQTFADWGKSMQPVKNGAKLA